MGSGRISNTDRVVNKPSNRGSDREHALNSMISTAGPATSGVQPRLPPSSAHIAKATSARVLTGASSGSEFKKSILAVQVYWKVVMIMLGPLNLCPLQKQNPALSPRRLSPKTKGFTASTLAFFCLTRKGSAPTTRWLRSLRGCSLPAIPYPFRTFDERKKITARNADHRNGYMKQPDLRHCRGCAPTAT